MDKASPSYLLPIDTRPNPLFLLRVPADGKYEGRNVVVLEYRVYERDLFCIWPHSVCEDSTLLEQSYDLAKKQHTSLVWRVDVDPPIVYPFYIPY